MSYKERPKFKTYKEYMYWRLDRRVQTLQSLVNKVKRYVDSMDDFPSDEEDRLWLEDLAIGNGLDVCCGDFLIGDAQGVNGGVKSVGIDYFCQGDQLAFQKSEQLDFVVTNYLDAFPGPLVPLNEWWRCLRPGGVLGIVCRNADVYTEATGPLENHRRVSLYNKKILSQYLYRTQFKKVEVVETLHKSLRAKAIK